MFPQGFDLGSGISFDYVNRARFGTHQLHTTTCMDPSAPAQAPLSEKAKGKRRAFEPDEGDDLSHGHGRPSSSAIPNGSAPPTSDTRKFTVRFSEGVPDLRMTVRSNDTVRDVQRRVSV
jgi:hypothetical protein